MTISLKKIGLSVIMAMTFLFAGFFMSACGGITITKIEFTNGILVGTENNNEKPIILSLNEELDLSNLAGRVTFSDEKYERFRFSDLKITGIDTSVAGEQTLVLKYKDYAFEYKVNYWVIPYAVTAYSGTYDGTEHSPVDVQNVAEGDVVTYSVNGQEFSSELAPIKNAGNYPIDVKIIANGKQEEDAIVFPAVAKIAKKQISVSVNNKSVQYGNEAPTYAYNMSTQNFVAGDDPNVLITTLPQITCDYKAGDNVGEYKITVSGAVESSGNYEFTYLEGKLTVKKKLIDKPTANETPFVYDKTEQTYLPVGFDETMMEISNNVQTDAGTYEVVVTTNSNHSWQNGDLEDPVFIFTISPITVEIEWGTTTFVYNGQEQTAEATLTGILEGDVCTAIIEGVRKDVGTETATVTGVSNSNYVAPKVRNSTEFSITPLEVELEWSNTEIEHTGEAVKPTAVVKNLCDGDVCEVEVLGEQTEVGNYIATANNLSNSNYKLPENVTCNFSIIMVTQESN